MGRPKLHAPGRDRYCFREALSSLGAEAHAPHHSPSSSMPMGEGRMVLNDYMLTT